MWLIDGAFKVIIHLLLLWSLVLIGQNSLETGFDVQIAPI